jgi:hypothetical protein
MFIKADKARKSGERAGVDADREMAARVEI